MERFTPLATMNAIYVSMHSLLLEIHNVYQNRTVWCAWVKHRCCCNFKTICALCRAYEWLESISMKSRLKDFAPYSNQANLDWCMDYLPRNADCSHKWNILNVYIYTSLVSLYIELLTAESTWFSIQFKLWQPKQNFNPFVNWIVHSNVWKSAVRLHCRSHSHSNENENAMKNAWILIEFLSSRRSLNHPSNSNWFCE